MESNKVEPPHPMVAVPDAIRKVLEETIKVCFEVTASNGARNDEIPLHTADAWRAAISRHLDEDVLMCEPGYPSYNASIMDGYAVSSKDSVSLTSSVGWTHRVVGRVHAGDATDSAKPPEPSGDAALPSACYITTGAVVPDTFDCVVPIEDCSISETGDKIRVTSSIDDAIQPGTWIRPVGCDIPPGMVVLPKGHTIDGVAIGLLKQVGVESIRVKKRISVGVLSTGNELLSEASGARPAASQGRIPDVNRPILLSLLESFGNCDPIDLGICRDDSPEKLAQTIQIALDRCDVIITSGGVSMGETDIVEDVLVEKCGGALHFGRLHMKPGKPTTFVTVPCRNNVTRLIFAMPGNPVSATVCTQLLVKPCVDLLSAGLPAGSTGATPADIVDDVPVHPELTVTIDQDIKLDFERPEYHRVVINFDAASGHISASGTGVQRSSRLMSLRDAQGLLVLPQATKEKPIARKGEKVTAVLIGNGTLVRPVKVKDSVHLKKEATQKVVHRIAILEVEPSDSSSTISSACEIIEKTLSGSNSGSVKVSAQRRFSGQPKELYPLAADISTSESIDVLIVYYKTHGRNAFKNHLELCQSFRDAISNSPGGKIADALAMQIRQGAASKEPSAALYESLVAFMPEGSMVVLISDQGLDGGLGNIRGLTKHALWTGRGKAHNHHHNHQ